MRFDLREIASILDEHIEKGERLERGRIDSIEKALSHNPFDPVQMGPDSEFYNPYLQLSDGSFAPHPVEHWAERGKDTRAYLTTQKFYRDAGVEESRAIAEPMRRFRDFQKSLDVVIKALPQTTAPKAPQAQAQAPQQAQGQAPQAGAGKGPAAQGGPGHGSGWVPIGTVHTYKDGQNYRKVSEGQWQPVVERQSRMVGDMLNHPKHGPAANAEMEQNAADSIKIKAALAKKEREQEVINTAKRETLKHVRGTLEKVYGEKGIPDEVKQHIEEGVRGHTAELETKIKRKARGEGREVQLKKNEIEQILKGGKYALISAGKNPNHKEDKNLDDSAIEQRYEKLRQDLVQGGYAFNKTKGHYGGEEDSFLVMVHDADKEPMKLLGKKYNQDSVIHSDAGAHEMHFTTGNKEGQHHTGQGHKITPEASDMYSEIKAADDGMIKFQLGLNTDKLHGQAKAERGLRQYQVDLTVGHGGKEYSKAVQVKATSHSEAISKVHDGVLKQIPGAVVKRIGAHAVGPGAPGDEDRPNNGSRKPEFNKAGKDVTVRDAENFIEEFHDDYVKMDGLGADLKTKGASHFGNRLKDEGSLTAKMNGRLKNRSLNTISDVIGARALALNVTDQQKVLEHIKNSHEVVEHTDYAANPKAGYRAQHLLVRTQSGKLAEIQIKTLRQQVFSGFTHDTVYKIPKNVPPEDAAALKGKEAESYIQKVSDHLWALDNGKDAGERPKEPEIFAKYGMKFPWHEVDAINRGDVERFNIKEAESKEKFKEWKNKHFVTVRDENKRNLSTKQFADFQSARDYRDKTRASGHQGELPMGYAHSKKEYLSTFSEYKKSPKRGA